MPKTEHCEGYVCPYCEHLNVPAWMFGGSCEKCERAFVAWEETATTYYARDAEGGQMLKTALTPKQTPRGHPDT